MRHIASVPKGYLKYLVLRLLGEKSLSGSEIMIEIKKETEGRWKPSPGSVYPLLAWLQDKGYTKIASEQEPGMKRYTLTDSGRAYLEEHVRRRKDIQERFGGFRPPFFMFHHFNSHLTETNELVEAGKNFIKANWKLINNLGEKYIEEAATQAKDVINQATERINEINKKLKQKE
jgi:DNA-binding PadR family transcriptional regulator